MFETEMKKKETEMKEKYADVVKIDGVNATSLRVASQLYLHRKVLHQSIKCVRLTRSIGLFTSC